MRRHVGPVLIVVGIVHILLFAVLFRDRYAAIARDGFVDTVDGNDKREAAFWTMGFGLLLLTVGHLLHVVQGRLGTVPAPTGWLFLLLGLGGGVLMPVSPFWLFVLLALAILRRPRPAGPPSSASGRPSPVGAGAASAASSRPPAR